MKKLTALFLFSTLSSAVAFAADRIYTNPTPDAALKQLFPNAVLTPLSGTPLHFTAYASDPVKNPSQAPLGYAFWTTDVVPSEHGYHGPIHLLVGMRLDGTLTGVVCDYHSEPYGYFSVEPTTFAAQFANKSIHDRFIVGADVNAVSRATLSMNSATRAVRDSSRMVARSLLSPDGVRK